MQPTYLTAWPKDSKAEPGYLCHQVARPFQCPGTGCRGTPSFLGAQELFFQLCVEIRRFRPGLQASLLSPKLKNEFSMNRETMKTRLVHQHQAPSMSLYFVLWGSKLVSTVLLGVKVLSLMRETRLLIQKHLFLCERHKRHVRVIEIFEEESEKLKFKKAPER